MEKPAKVRVLGAVHQDFQLFVKTFGEENRSAHGNPKDEVGEADDLRNPRDFLEELPVEEGKPALRDDCATSREKRQIFADFPRESAGFAWKLRGNARLLRKKPQKAQESAGNRGKQGKNRGIPGNR